MTKLSTLKGFGATSSGGGDSSSSSATLYDDELIRNDSGWTANTTYAATMRTAGGQKGNTFFFARMEYNGSQSDTRLRVYPFTVDRSSGLITLGTASNVFNNTSGPAISTTYFTGPDGTGAVFSGGHNAYPGYSSHVFGYAKFIVNANGTISDNSTSYTNADHGYNGGFSSLPSSINTGRFLSAGYNQNSGSTAHYRIHYMNGSSISVGSLTTLNSNTSTSYGVSMISQPNVYQTGNQVVSLIYFQDNSYVYKVRALSANGSIADHTVTAWDSNAFAFQMTNGDVILYSDAHTPLKFTAYNSSTSMTSAKPWPGGNMYYSFNHFGLGNNEFILSLSNSSPLAFGVPLVKATLNATTGFTITGVTTPDYFLSLGMESSYGGMFPLYASSSDASPDKILYTRMESYYVRTKVADFPTFRSV